MCGRDWEGRDQRAEAVSGHAKISKSVLKWGTRVALRRHLDQDVPTVMETIKISMQSQLSTSTGEQEEALKEAEAACRCVESWLGYGLGGE